MQFVDFHCRGCGERILFPIALAVVLDVLPCDRCGAWHRLNARGKQAIQAQWAAEQAGPEALAAYIAAQTDPYEAPMPADLDLPAGTTVKQRRAR